MDFLDIRKKAKQRGATAAAPASPPAPSPRAAEAASPAPAALAPAGDARFATWRPGSGPPPVVPPSPPSARSHLEPERTAPAEASVAAFPPRAAPPPAPAFPPAARIAAATDVAGPLEDFFYRDGEEAPALGGAPVPAAAAPGDDSEEREGTDREEYLTFILGDEEYAVGIERVREVLKSPPITEVPRAPAHVLGVVTVRGEVVAVVDPRRRLGLPEPGRHGGGARLVIVDAGDGPCALLVDCVASVVRLRPGSIEPRPQGFGGAAAECLAGIGRDRDRLFTVLDLGALLKRAPAPRRAPGEGRPNAGA